ncbi:MAG: divalent-cation tolerance protein CutA [Pseudomonadota bacterium]
MSGMWMAETTVPDEELAQHLAQVLVARRLAACVHVTPIASVYRWQGAVQTDEEFVLSIKTVEDRLEAVEAAIKEHHPYEVIAFFAHFVPRINDEYATWLEDATRPG